MKAQVLAEDPCRPEVPWPSVPEVPEKFRGRLYRKSLSHDFDRLQVAQEVLALNEVHYLVVPRELYEGCGGLEDRLETLRL
eukprot:5110114-Alexandrium_andersonii.AAC.1